MFSVITNIYNKKTKGPTLMEFFTTTGKLFFKQLEMFDVCTTGDTAHIDTTFKILPHTRQHVDACVALVVSLFQSPVALTQGKNPGAHWIGGWMGPNAGLCLLEKSRIVPNIFFLF